MFHKYSSIENIWYQKEIDWWLEMFPHLKDAEYILTEKIDGCNTSIVIEPDGCYYLAGRSGIINPKENFYNFNFIVERKYIDVINTFIEYAIEWNSSLNIYGEFFGTGIQNRIAYSDGKHLLFFDIAINDRFLSPESMIEFLNNLNLSYMTIPDYGIVKGLDNALAFDVEDLESNICDDFTEGIVIKPYKGAYFVPYSEDTPTTKLGRLFYLKKKGSKFKENSGKKKRINKKPIDERLKALNEAFREYFNKNRVLSVFSKHGEIQRKEQIGDYIKLILNDMREDFDKDYHDELQGWKKKELKYVYNISKDILKYLYDYL